MKARGGGGVEAEGAWAGGESAEEEERVRERESGGHGGGSVSRKGSDAGGSNLDTSSHFVSDHTTKAFLQLR